MPKKQLTEDEYIAELNRQLRQHRDYREGMAFVPAPEGATGRKMSGNSVTGPFSELGTYGAIANKVAEQYSLKV